MKRAPVTGASNDEMISALNGRMVDSAKASGAIRSVAVEAAFRAVPRHLFLPGVAYEQVYSGDVVVTQVDDKGQPRSSSSQVAIMAPMLEDLDVQHGHRVLEIGTGTGYNAALLDRLTGQDGQVVTIEVDPSLAAQAREHLAAAGHDRVEVVVGDGYTGHVDRAPYDRIIATASVPDIPLSWRDQLAEGGRLTVPLRLRGGAQLIVTFERSGDSLKSVATVIGGFMQLRTEREWKESTVAIDGDWEAVLVSVQDGDGAILADLLRGTPTLEPLGEIPWQVVSTMGLLEPDWITVRQRQKPFGWSGVYDRASRALALIWSLPLPMGATRWTLLVYGPATARDRLMRLVDAAAGTDVRDLSVVATPIVAQVAAGDRDGFRYSIERRPRR